MANGRRTILPPPWRRVDTGTDKLFAQYEHPKGYVIQHCGHPTANFPYALYGPGGDFIPAPNGRAFMNLKAAAWHVAEIVGPDDPNGCAECARSHGPHYTGRCTH